MTKNIDENLWNRKEEPVNGTKEYVFYQRECFWRTKALSQGNNCMYISLLLSYYWTTKALLQHTFSCFSMQNRNRKWPNFGNIVMILSLSSIDKSHPYFMNLGKTERQVSNIQNMLYHLSSNLAVTFLYLTINDIWTSSNSSGRVDIKSGALLLFQPLALYSSSHDKTRSLIIPAWSVACPR